MASTPSAIDLEMQNIRRASDEQQQERDAQREMAFRVIDVGYKALAREQRTDHGGSAHARAEVRAVRDRLKRDWWLPLGARRPAL